MNVPTHFNRPPSGNVNSILLVDLGYLVQSFFVMNVLPPQSILLNGLPLASSDFTSEVEIYIFLAVILSIERNFYELFLFQACLYSLGSKRI
ncbi:hypothetical protein CW304_29390 [Bacillus sp. UFRGS-B20]|nr:hypothetical protein CW304_29390 [Bacillus sp. UFRGS-B20]